MLAALATVIAITAMRPTQAPPSPDASRPAALIQPGHVTVPVLLAIGGSSVSAGDIVDLVAVNDAGDADVVASRAVVTEPSTSGYASGSVVLMAMPREDALAVTAATARAQLSVLIH